MAGNNADQTQAKTQGKRTVMNSHNGNTTRTHGFAPVNDLEMHYEIEGNGDPLVFIPPAFGFAGLQSFPALTPNHSVITVDLQGNGRTRGHSGTTPIRVRRTLYESEHRAQSTSVTGSF